jgi:hypothetical protein
MKTQKRNEKLNNKMERIWPFMYLTVAVLFFSSNVALAGEEDPAIWFENLTGMAPESVSTSLALHEGSGTEPCFPEEELQRLCELNFSNVTFLSIYRDSCPKDEKITELGIRFIGQCLPNLEAIDLDGNDLESLGGIEHLPDTMREITLLKSYDLKNANFTPLAKFTELSSLNLKQVALTDQSFGTLISPSLQVLRFESDELRSLQGIENRLPNLHYLIMTIGTQLSIDSLRSVTNLSHLLYMPGITLTQEAKEWMLSDSTTVFITNDITEDELLTRLEDPAPLDRVFVERDLTVNETRTLLASPVATVIVNVIDLDEYLNVVREIDQVENSEIIYNEFHLLIYVDKSGKYMMRIDEVVDAFEGKTTPLKAHYPLSKYNRNNFSSVGFLSL